MILLGETSRFPKFILSPGGVVMTYKRRHPAFTFYLQRYYQFVYTRKSNQFIYRSLINVMATFEEVVKKIRIKFKILDLAVKENERNISINKVSELVKQQKVLEKRCS